MNLISKILGISLATLAACIGSTGMFINFKEKVTVVSTDTKKANLKKKYTQCVNNVNARYGKYPRLKKRYLNKCEKP